MQYDEFVRNVEQRSHVDGPEEAERTAFVVLDALGARLSGGEADDLYAQLPDPLKTQLLTRVRADKPARSMTADQYLARVAEDLGVDTEEAARRVRGVFDVVRKVVSPDEFDDVLSQLDSSYRGLVARRAP